MGRYEVRGRQFDSADEAADYSVAQGLNGHYIDHQRQAMGDKCYTRQRVDRKTKERFTGRKKFLGLF